jgi:hypothetical protein
MVPPIAWTSRLDLAMAVWTGFLFNQTKSLPSKSAGFGLEYFADVNSTLNSLSALC